MHLVTRSSSSYSHLTPLPLYIVLMLAVKRTISKDERQTTCARFIKVEPANEFIELVEHAFAHPSRDACEGLERYLKQHTISLAVRTNHGVYYKYDDVFGSLLYKYGMSIDEWRIRMFKALWNSAPNMILPRVIRVDVMNDNNHLIGEECDLVKIALANSRLGMLESWIDDDLLIPLRSIVYAHDAMLCPIAAHILRQSHTRFDRQVSEVRMQSINFVTVRPTLGAVLGRVYENYPLFIALGTYITRVFGALTSNEKECILSSLNPQLMTTPVASVELRFEHFIPLGFNQESSKFKMIIYRAYLEWYDNVRINDITVSLKLVDDVALDRAKQHHNTYQCFSNDAKRSLVDIYERELNARS